MNPSTEQDFLSLSQCSPLARDQVDFFRREDYLTVPDVFDPEDLPKTPVAAVTAICPRGGVVFMHNLTPHCSTPNTSDHIRWSVDLRYQAAEAPNNEGLWPSLEDRDHEDSDFMKNVNVACYPPEADFLVYSRKNPEFVVTYQDFVRRREHFEKMEITFRGRGWKTITL